MKKNTYAKLFGLALTAALTVTALTACGGAPQTEALPDNTASAPLVQEDPRRQRGHRTAERQSGDRDGLR